MSLGQWLDDALTTAQQAAAAAERHGIAVPDLLATFYARDRAWLALARAADLIRGARLPQQRSLGAASRELTDPTASPIRLLAVGAHAAVIRPPRSADVRLAAMGPLAGLLVAAGDHLAVTADILATHVTPRNEDERGLMVQTKVDLNVKALARSRHRTMVGAAIVGGIDRAEAVGELSRIAQAWHRVDQALDAGDNPAAAYLGRVEAEHLHRWVQSPFAAFFAVHARAGPALMLRQIEAASTPDRSSGPRPINGFDDVLRTVTDISTAVKHDRRLVTARLLAGVSRIGFAVEALSSRIAGEKEPGPQTKQRGARWLAVRLAVADVHDLRDDVTPELADEAVAAAIWLREHVRGWTPLAHSTRAPYDLGAMREQLASVATQSIEPWRQALTDGDVLTLVHDGLATESHRGIKPVEYRWQSAGPLDPRGRAVMHRLADAAADTHPAWTHAANHQARRLRREEASAANDINTPPMQVRRRHLQLAVRTNDIADQARLVAAYLHAQIEQLRSGDNHANWPPRTVEQKTLREKVDALERELARQQQRLETARAAAEMHRVEAGLSTGQDPAHALTRLEADMVAPAPDGRLKDIDSDEQHQTTTRAPSHGAYLAQEHAPSATTAIEPPPTPQHRPPTAGTAAIGARERADTGNEL